MAHHEIDLFLVVAIHRFSFRDYTPYELMVVLAGTFLLALAGVAVEDPAEPYSRIGIRFDLDRIGELAAIVGKQYGEKPCKHIFAEELAQGVKHLGYGGGAVALPDVG